MTLMDHSHKGGQGAILRAAAARRDARAKGDADVADLLGVSSHDSNVFPAISPGDEAANALLDVIAQDHLERAGAGPADGDTPSLMQKEIDALLDPSRRPGEFPPEPVLAPKPPRGELSDDELAVLLPGSSGAAAAPPDMLDMPDIRAPEFAGADPLEAPTSADAVRRELEEERLQAHFDADLERIAPEEARALSEAEGVLAEELAALQQPAARAPTLPDIHETTPDTREVAVTPPPDGLTARAEISPESALPPIVPVPVIILQPDEPDEDDAPRPGLLARVRRTAGESALMAAQLVDLPFSWLSGLDKHLVGVIAVVFFLSGWLLVALGWWLAR